MAASTATRASTRANSSHQPFQENPTMQQFVIGKIDAGIAVLISDSVHLIEFPSLLLPTGVGPGSIVNIACTRNSPAEKQHARDFWDLQDDIAQQFGAREPSPPQLRIRNTTQTSVTLEWDPLDLAAADLVNLSIYRNGQRLTTIPNPKSNTSTKLSGLQLDTDYAFHLVLKTTAGQYASSTVKTRTHTIDNTTGISVCFGLVEPPQLADDARNAIAQLGAKADDRIQIDTTHFVATSSAARENPNGPPCAEYQKATQLSIPVVTPEWLLACAQSKKLVPISAYYLGQTNRAASLSSAQLVNPTSASASSTSLQGASSRSPSQQQQQQQQQASQSQASPTAEALPQVQERDEVPEEESTPRPPVELEEDVEAPPSDQAVVSPPVTTSGPQGPYTPLGMSGAGGAQQEEEEGENAPGQGTGSDEQDDSSSMRGVKSSGEGEREREGGSDVTVGPEPEAKAEAEQGEDAADAGDAAPVSSSVVAETPEEAGEGDSPKQPEEEAPAAENDPAPWSGSPSYAQVAAPDDETDTGKAPSPPPTISVTPPNEEPQTQASLEEAKDPEEVQDAVAVAVGSQQAEAEESEETPAGESNLVDVDL